MKFSIVVPVYNVEKYIRKCIESIITQTYQNFELIIVDDGSTDYSGKICDKYINKSNVKVFHKKNGGASSARNYGIKKSKGEYLMFIDGDDFLYDVNCLEELNKIINNSNVDIIQYKMIYYYDKSKKFKKLPDIVKLEQNTLVEKLDYLNTHGQLSISACDKIVKSSIIKNNNIYFNENIRAEDIDWSLNLYLYAKSLKILNYDIYVYRQQREGSFTNKINSYGINSLFEVINYWYKYKYANKRIRDIYFNYLAYQYVILLTVSNKNNTNKTKSKEILKLKSLLKYDKNFKVKYSRKVFDLFGINLGIKILKIYLKIKNIGFLKI